MSAVNVHLIFWLPTGYHFNPDDATAAGDQNYEQLIGQYFTDIGGSEMYNIVTQYNDTSYHPNAVTLDGSYVETKPFPTSHSLYCDASAQLCDSEVQAEITSAMQTNGWTVGAYPTDFQNLFFVYIPAGAVECTDTPGAISLCSGRDFSGYHNFFSLPLGSSTTCQAIGDCAYPVYSVLSDIGSAAGGGPTFPHNSWVDPAISTASHELFESVTDPYGASWFHPTAAYGDVEIADLCQSGVGVSFGPEDGSGANVVLNGHGYQVQLEYSNAALGCTSAYDGQFINFGTLGNRTFGNAPFTVGADATSGLPVAFTAAGPCSVSGSQVTLTGVGSCTITANQAGDKSQGGFYDPAAPVAQTFSITTGTPAFTFDLSTLPAKAFGDPSFSVAGYAAKPVDDTGAITFATGAGSIGCNVSSDGTVTITGVATGTDACVLTASLAADANYAAAGPITQSFGIAQAVSTVTVTCPTPDPTYTGSPVGGCTAAATGAGNLDQPLTVTYTGRNSTTYASSTTPPTDAGDYTASATFGGDALHTGNSGSADFSVAQAGQTITFGPLSDRTLGDPAFTVSATGGASGNPVTFSASPAGVCTASGTNGATITLVGAGTCTVTANQAGSTDYAAAAPVAQQFSVAQAGQTYSINVLFDQTKAKKSGSTLPVKLRLIDAGGSNVSSPALTVTALDVDGSPGLLHTAGKANPGGVFRCDQDQYILNLKTTGLTAGTHTLHFLVSGSQTVYNVTFTIK